MSQIPPGGGVSKRTTACFSVHGSAELQFMPRVMQVLMRAGLMPAVWHSVLCGSEEGEIQIDLQIEGLDAAAARKLAQTLRALPCVGCVLTSEKRATLSA